MPRKKKAPRAQKIAPKRVTITRDTVTLPDSSYQPSKAEMEEEFSFFSVTGTKPEDWGDTPEEQLRNTMRHTFRPVKIRREKRPTNRPAKG